MTKRYRQLRFQNWIKQMWQRLTPEQQRQIKSANYSFWVHLSLILILAAVGIGMQKDEPVCLVMSVAQTEAETVALCEFEVTEEPEIEELELLEEPSEPVTFEIAEPIAPDFAVSELPDITDQLAVQPLGNGEPLSVAASPAELAGDSRLVAEVHRLVSAAGGKTDGPICVSLMFSGDDDLDLHVFYGSQVTQNRRMPRNQPGNLFGFGFQQVFGNSFSSEGNHVYFRQRVTQHAALDVDANAQYVMPNPCENIIFRSVPARSNYTVCVDTYAVRGRPERTPYVVVVKYGQKTRVFEGMIGPSERMKNIWQFQF